MADPPNKNNKNNNITSSNRPARYSNSNSNSNSNNYSSSHNSSTRVLVGDGMEALDDPAAAAAAAIRGARRTYSGRNGGSSSNSSNAAAAGSSSGRSSRTDAERERDRELRRRERLQKQLKQQQQQQQQPQQLKQGISLPPPPPPLSITSRPTSPPQQQQLHNPFETSFAVVVPPTTSTATTTSTTTSANKALTSDSQQFDSTPTRISKREQIFQTLGDHHQHHQQRAVSSTSHSAKWLQLTSNPSLAASTSGALTTTTPSPTPAAGGNYFTSSSAATIASTATTTTSTTSSTRRQSAIIERKSSTSAAQLSAAAALLAANFSEEPNSSIATTELAPNTALLFSTKKFTMQPPSQLQKNSSIMTTTADPPQQQSLHHPQHDHKPSTDTNGSSSSSSSTTSWALTVRILSAVDLPPNFTPSAPLCPLVKCGLVTDPELAVECETIMRTATTKLPPFHPKHHPTKDSTSTTTTTTNNNNNTNNLSLLREHLNSELSREAEQSRMMRLNGAVQQLGVAHMPFVHSNVRFTTGKIILSKTDNGTAEFQEEIRWDGLTNPMATTLVLELCAKSMPPQHHHQHQQQQQQQGSTRIPTTTQKQPQQYPPSSSSSSTRYYRTVDGSATSSSFHASTTRSDADNISTKAEWNSRSKSLNIDPSSYDNISDKDKDKNNNDNNYNAPNGSNKCVVDSSSTARAASVNATKNSRSNLLGQLWQRRPRVSSAAADGGGGSTTPERGKAEIHETANAAAAVAKFIMEGTQQLTGSGSHHFSKSSEAAATTTKTMQQKKSSESSGASRRGSSNSLGGRNSSRRRFENASIGWIERGSSSDDDENEWSTDDDETNKVEAKTADPLDSNNTSNMVVGPAEANDDYCCELVEDLRIASLSIPLCRLPFDAHVKKASTSRWYSMSLYGSTSAGVGPSTPATGTAPTNNSSSLSSFTVNSPPSAPSPPSDNSSNTIVMAHKRSPSVLLELCFASTEDLNDAEDKVVDDEGESSLMWGDDEQSENAINGSDDEDFDKQRQEKDVLTENNTAVDMSPPIKASRRKNNTVERQRSASTMTGGCEEPVLEPGIVDYICVVGPKSIGSQRHDDGSKGWVESNPELCVLERFPKTDDFHIRNGRQYAILPNMVEWFCFPESCKLWRGTDPPTHFDLKPRSSSSLPSQTISAFDSCLKCASNFTWFVISSTGENYGSKTVKTYGAVIRFFAPAPYCIDSTQDDYAQFHTVVNDGGENDAVTNSSSDGLGGCDPVTGTAENPIPVETSANTSMAKQWSWSLKRKRLWVPLAICLTSQLPIVGILEAMLLQICETLASKAKSSEALGSLLGQVHVELANLIVNFSSPIPGVLNCSIPFLGGERLHVTQPPPAGLPPLPHGSCITAVCRLLGAEGLTTLLAAVLTECKIIIHSSDISNLAMVAETVVGALIYPFSWALPYIPVLPEAMLEFVEAPLSYFLGVPTSVMKCIEKSVLKDIVVFDLDQAGSPDYFDGGRRDAPETKRPKPLPAGVSSSITKAVFRLLQQEEEVEEEYYSKSASFTGSRQISPRLEAESLAEREFRVSVARQICGLMRGYQECLFFVSNSQPVFNRDRFLRNAPALFEQRKGSLDTLDAAGRISTFLSPRAKRFLSLLVNTQHFHQLLERLDSDNTSFFHEVMDTFESEELKDSVFSSGDEAVRHLCENLQKLEDKIPTYRVDRYDTEQLAAMGSPIVASWEVLSKNIIPSLAEVEEDEEQLEDASFNFVHQLLLPITVPSGSRKTPTTSTSSEMSAERGVKSLSVELLIELENHPWRYNGILDFPSECQSDDPIFVKLSKALQVRKKVEVKKAIGERRYRVYKLMLQQKAVKSDDSISAIDPSQEYNAIDLNSLLSSVNEQELDGGSSGLPFTPSTHMELGRRSAEQSLQDGKDRDAVRRCLERAYEGASQTLSTSSQFKRRGSNGTDSQQEGLTFLQNGRDLIQEAEAALRNPTAQRFLITVLSKRARFETQRRARLLGAAPVSMGKSRSFRKSLDRMSVSRLVPAAFECLVRLCCAMLEACVETQDYDAAYTLLTHTTGFCTVKQGTNAENIITDSQCLGDDQESQQNQVIYMTARIGMHPIFADVRLWECVLQMHLQGRLQSSKESSRSNSFQLEGDKSYTNEYEAAVSTLYEMVAFGVPAEELALFATRVSETRGWFSSEKGQAILLLARRLGLRRGDVNGALAASGTGNDIAPALSPDRAKTLESFMTERRSSVEVASNIGAGVILDVAQMEWQELSWVHPTASTAGRTLSTSIQTSTSRRSQGPTVKPEADDVLCDGVLVPVGYEGRSAIASLASFGASVVATGGVDGSVFLAHTLRFPDRSSSVGRKRSVLSAGEVRGVRVECGKDNGAVICLAAAKGVGYKQAASSQTFSDDEESFSVLEGCRIVGGTTGGALRVWCLKDIYATTSIVSNTSDASDILSTEVHGSDRDAQYIRSGQQSIANKLKWSLKGRALSGHRGGVTCLDVPSPIYRPETLMSGGSDGLIKLWSLRHVTRRSARAGSELPTSRFFGRSDADKRTSSNDAQETLSGHAGRVICIKTAWHGDGMLSGGADKTVRLWDISSTGKCLLTFEGHSCWVTQTHYWGQNNIVSASTDRSVALWDARGGKLPLFILRYHKSPVSDILMGSRNDPLLVSASGDGTIATWDFRSLSSSNDPKASAKSRVHTLRTPAAKMNHRLDLMSNTCCGAVLLARGTGLYERSVLSASIDGRIKEWDIQSGKHYDDQFTRHTDAISCLSTFTESDGLRRGKTGSASSVGGTLTCSWDGTVRVKSLLLKGTSDG